MWQRIILCCLIVANVGECKININDFKQKDPSERLKNDARELVEMCLTNNSNPVMISEDLFDNNWDLVRNSLIIIDRKFNKQITGFLPTYPTYVLSFNSIDNFEPMIDNLQRSKFWSIKSTFVIVGTGSSCLNAGGILKFMWDRDLLSVYYLCNKRNSTVIFTLNPYASYAPAPWKFVDSKFSDSKNKTSLFRIKFTTGSRICRSITFDKTEYVERAEITFINTVSSVGKKKVRKVKKSIGIGISEIPALINATLTQKYIPLPNYLDLLEQGYIEQLVNYTGDVYSSIMPIEITNYSHVDVIANYVEKSISIATKKTNFLTMISDLTEDVRFVVGTMVLFVMFTILMFMINKNDLKLATLDMVRLVVGMGLETPLNRLVMKFLLFVGFLYGFLIVPDFQGHLSAILSDPLRRNVETLRDLYENKYEVYYWFELENDIRNEQLWVTEKDQEYLHPRTIRVMNNCFKVLYDNPKVACIHVTNVFLGPAYSEPELHISKEPIFKKQFVNWVRKNWPLKDKFEETLIKNSEPGFESTIINRRFIEGLIKKKLTLIMRSEESENYEQFDFNNLIFIYYFIGYGIVFAFIVFLMEILLRYFRNYRRL